MFNHHIQMSEKDQGIKNIFDTVTLVLRPEIKKSADFPDDSNLFPDEELGPEGEIAAIRRLVSSMSEEKSAPKDHRDYKRDLDSAGECWTPPQKPGRLTEDVIVPALIKQVGMADIEIVIEDDKVSGRQPSMMEGDIDLAALTEIIADFKAYLETTKVKFRRGAVYLLLDYLFGNFSGINLTDKDELFKVYQNEGFGFNKTFLTLKAFEIFMLQIVHLQLYLVENQLLSSNIHPDVHPDVQIEFHKMFKEFIIKR